MLLKVVPTKRQTVHDLRQIQELWIFLSYDCIQCAVKIFFINCFTAVAPAGMIFTGSSSTTGGDTKGWGRSVGVPLAPAASKYYKMFSKQHWKIKNVSRLFRSFDMVKWFFAMSPKTYSKLSERIYAYNFEKLRQHPSEGSKNQYEKLLDTCVWRLF